MSLPFHVLRQKYMKYIRVIMLSGARAPKFYIEVKLSEQTKKDRDFSKMAMGISALFAVLTL